MTSNTATYTITGTPITGRCLTPGRASRPTCLDLKRYAPGWLNVPAGVLRLKGILRTGLQNNNSAWSELQCAGRQGSLHNASTPDAGAALVSISLRGHRPPMRFRRCSTHLTEAVTGAHAENLKTRTLSVGLNWHLRTTGCIIRLLLVAHDAPTPDKRPARPPVQGEGKHQPLGSMD